MVGFKLIYDQGRIEHVKKFVNSDFKELPDESRKRYINKAAFIKDFFDFSEMEKSFNKVWSFLGKKDKVHVIHLKRRNLLEAFYSYKIASLTDSWSSKYPSGIKTPDSIVLSISDCEYFFQERRKEEKIFDELFKEHRLLNLYYEDLLNSKQKTMKEVFRYFQLEPIDSDPDFKKQNNTPLNQSIRNYNELKKHFTDTEWFSFFNY